MDLELFFQRWSYAKQALSKVKFHVPKIQRGIDEER
jgi:hypothetical protein